MFHHFSSSSRIPSISTWPWRPPEASLAPRARCGASAPHKSWCPPTTPRPARASTPSRSGWTCRKNPSQRANHILAAGRKNVLCHPINKIKNKIIYPKYDNHDVGKKTYVMSTHILTDCWKWHIISWNSPIMIYSCAWLSKRLNKEVKRKTVMSTHMWCRSAMQSLNRSFSQSYDLSIIQ